MRRLHEQHDRLAIALRAYTAPPQPRLPEQGKSKGQPRRSLDRPSPWVVVFDTETTVDADQALRFGAYEVYNKGELYEAGIFYQPDVLTANELSILMDYAEAHGLVSRTRASFVDDIFYKIGYELRATIVGLNLPFDLSRLAIRHGSARGGMRGGFSFTLSEDKRRPGVQIKHLSQRASLIQFAAPFRQRLSRSERRRNTARVIRRGFFVDIRTLAAALYSRPFSLAHLADFLNVQVRKMETEAHGQILTPDYLDYAVQDVRVTWACYSELVHRYEKLELVDTPVHRILSEASLGKAYLKAMRIRPWRDMQGCPPNLLARIMSAYFGGRSEVRIRRNLCQVMLCDFLSMYPTVCTLMGLWQFVIAQGMTWRDGTDEIRELLDACTLTDLQDPLLWRKLTVLVQVKPDKDIFPVRARYEETGQATIGANHLTSDHPLWFTLADCLASKLLNGRAPAVEKALIFEPNDPQADLKSIAIGGNSAYTIDPYTQDFYQRLIELRADVKRQRESASGPEREALDTEQNALKIAANATSYGVFVEVNIKERAKRGRTIVHSGVFDPFEAETDKDETPGIYYHPLLATLITGAARLMLAMTEKLVDNQGLEWAFCDTDSLAIAKPGDLPNAEFLERVKTVVAWFETLNPYDFKGSILKIEDVNFSLDDRTRFEPLYCWAISAKRYALFNLDSDRKPVLRKASAHGLGHLLPPYDEKSPSPQISTPRVPLSELGVELWQHDLWWTILTSALRGEPDVIDLGFHSALDQPAVSRYAATTPALLAWFKHYNKNRPYDHQVKPFNFLLAMSVSPLSSTDQSGTLISDNQPAGRKSRHAPKPIAPYTRNPARDGLCPFDRETGEPITVDVLKTYREALAQYHLHPESKFLNGNYMDRGATRRRHVFASSIEHIGKEANRWEQQFYLGLDQSAQLEYGSSPQENANLVKRLKEASAQIGQRALSAELGVSRNHLTRLIKNEALRLTPEQIARIDSILVRAAGERELQGDRETVIRSQLAQSIATEGLSVIAKKLGIDPSNLRKVVAGRRRLGTKLTRRLQLEGD
ncbi:hypothetical protein AB4072_08415 [Microvirga sp. 2MCAF38]|uniref:hypothetical protein n=1 Tax=Microvirga sp. 2MCAF38 TaxID=3232989 RepID=UPI003F97A7B8